MQRQSISSIRWRQAGALLLVGLGLALISCSDKTGERVRNIAPHVRLTGGPVQGDSVSYTAEFFWTGWDEDGIIDHYQYAIDIPDSLLGSIDDPAEHRIAWVDTTAFRASFLFTTPVQDTILMPDGSSVLPDRFRGDHHFYVRAFDNEEGLSPADKIGFTARTVTPSTTITLPKVASSSTMLLVGRQLNVSWTGTDPDSPDPKRRPAYYEWKLVPGINPSGVDVQYAVTIRPGPNFEWNRVSADTTTLRLNLNPPEEYVLAIRAVDEAGGVESKFYTGQNALVLASSVTNPGTPTVVVQERALGSFSFPTGEVFDVEVAAGRCMTFHFSADAQAYGGVVQGYNYGVDVPDVEQEGPASGFRGWSTYPGTYDPICFTVPGTHTLTIKVRDTGGGVTIGTIIIRVVGFPMDRELVYIDDFLMTRFGLVGDDMMDTRVHQMLQAVGFTDLYQIDVFGTGDLQFVPTIIKLSDLSRYRMALWSNWGSGYAAASALTSANACPIGRVLQAYVEAGGGVWIYGQQVFGTFKATSPTSCTATVGYDESNPLNFTGTEFGVEYMGLTGARFYDVKQDTKTSGMARGRPTTKALAEYYPTVEIDSTVYLATTRGGIGLVDALFTPVYSAGLDTLYTMDTPKTNSAFRNKPVAFRYLNPDPGSRQGPLAVFGFPFHVLKQGTVFMGEDDRGQPILKGTGVKGMAASMFRWLRQNQRVAKAG
jgi:hypothetical protein